jgi:maltooligosyltrehalose trehalohydrolase
VRTGRRHEFADHGWAEEDVPDPQDPATFARSRLDWSELDREPHRAALAWYRELLWLRRAEPELADPRLDQVQVRYDAAARWVVVHRGTLRIACNLGGGEQAVPLDAPAREVLASSGDGRLDGGALVMSAESVAVVRVGPAGSAGGATAAAPK